MFVFQKLKYQYKVVNTFQDLLEMEGTLLNLSDKSIITFDTETTGLNFMRDQPFVAAYCVKPYVYVVPMLDEKGKGLNNQIVNNILPKFKHAFAHNTKYDRHMYINKGIPLDDENLADGMTVARLTSYADDENSGIGLDDLGTKYVDTNAKFAADAIRERMNAIRKERMKDVRPRLKAQFGIKATQPIIDAYHARVQFVETEYDEMFTFIDSIYKEPNYLDVYLENPDLMHCYVADDVVILFEYLLKAIPIMNVTHPGDQVFTQECQLISVVGDMERSGWAVDIPYLLESRLKVKAYIEKVYQEMWATAGVEFSSGQHNVIKDLFLNKYDIFLSSADADAFDSVVDGKCVRITNKPDTFDEIVSIKDKEGNDVFYFVWFPEEYKKNKKKWLVDNYGSEPYLRKTRVETEPTVPSEDAKKVASLIIELRTLDKWMSTYIEGMLNRVDGGRIYSSINNSGAVTGRVSCDLQQQPKEALFDKDGNELFHPRGAFVTDPGWTDYFFDFSQMELRLQAEYTLKVSTGDLNLCRAFIPFKCRSVLDGAEYIPGNDDWNTGEWVDENDKVWVKTDLHNVTTMRAFPDKKPGDPDWDHYRRLGKIANFLKNYAGGYKAIMRQLHVSEEIARRLDKAYYESFPKVLDYQKWVDSELSRVGFVENIYGRRYYIQSQRNFYKGYNYVVQGGCADLMKEKEIKVWDLLHQMYLEFYYGQWSDQLEEEVWSSKEPFAKMKMVIHDELIVSIRNDFVGIVDRIKEVMDDNKDKVKLIPMLCDVEKSTSSWNKKEDVE